ncbi:hypothetical protein E2C01_100357 [Portunus trituberculatus]|uniref:Uncharacterized protein n=1 Tax=Portunus trituberculatus TaxID=210409 RepID=A0A5B7KHS4_PORTR|nr:hypothetical protein [Portunus trituberculatus]
MSSSVSTSLRLFHYSRTLLVKQMMESIVTPAARPALPRYPPAPRTPAPENLIGGLIRSREGVFCALRRKKAAEKNTIIR